MWTFLEVFICGKICFQHSNHHSYFLLKLCVLNCALLEIHHCLFWVQKRKNQKFSAIFKRSNVNFLSYFSLNKALSNTSSHLCWCICVRVWKSTWESSMCFVLFAWFARARLLAGIVTTATGIGCNEWKHLVHWEWSAFKCSDTKVVFQTAIFLILVVRNNKRSSGIEGKPATAFPHNCLYYRYLELHFC